jgi:hypothetical protein
MLPMDDCILGPSPALWLPRQAAEYLNVTTGWLANLRTTGDGPPYVKLSRRVYYRRADLDAWINACVLTPASSAGTELAA